MKQEIDGCIYDIIEPGSEEDLPVCPNCNIRYSAFCDIGYGWLGCPKCQWPYSEQDLENHKLQVEN